MEFFYYVRVLDNIRTAYMKLRNSRRHLDNLNTVCNDQPNQLVEHLETSRHQTKDIL